MSDEQNNTTIEQVLRSVAGNDQAQAAWREIGRSMAICYAELRAGGVPDEAAQAITSAAVMALIGNLSSQK